jgi:hypothetical protein
MTEHYTGLALKSGFNADWAFHQRRHFVQYLVMVLSA